MFHRTASADASGRNSEAGHGLAKALSLQRWRMVLQVEALGQPVQERANSLEQDPGFCDTPIRRDSHRSSVPIWELQKFDVTIGTQVQPSKS